MKIVWLWPGFCFGSKQQVIIMCYVLRFFIFLQVSMSGIRIRIILGYGYEDIASSKA